MILAPVVGVFGVVRGCEGGAKGGLKRRYWLSSLLEGRDLNQGAAGPERRLASLFLVAAVSVRPPPEWARVWPEPFRVESIRAGNRRSDVATSLGPVKRCRQLPQSTSV